MMTMMDTKPIIQRVSLRCRVYLERYIESNVIHPIELCCCCSQYDLHDLSPLVERLTMVNLGVTWAWRHSSPQRHHCDSEARSFLSEEMLALVVASSIRGRVPNAAMMMYVCRCAMWISPELSRPEWIDHDVRQRVRVLMVWTRIPRYMAEYANGGLHNQKKAVLYRSQGEREREGEFCTLASC